MDNIDYLKQIFDDIRKESENTTQQGKCFENLIQQWLMAEPTYKDNYLKVLTYSAYQRRNEFVFYCFRKYLFYYKNFG